MPIHLKGLTWDHPRATRPLQAAAEPLESLHPDITVTWEAQPLAGFEARPLHEAADAYDLIVFDHPHVGEAAAGGWLLPVDSLLHAQKLHDSDFVGPSLSSYRWQGQTWGLPLDAACQVSCWRGDLLDEVGASVPSTWSEVLSLGEKALSRQCYLGIALAGVHSLMTLFSLCASQGAPLVQDDADELLDRNAARAAFNAMRALLAFCPTDVLDWNTIALQDAMSSRDDLLYCPAVYGFSPYAERSRQRRLTYGNLPGLTQGCAGSTLGGAGLGISARSKQADAALTIAAYLVSADVQTEVIAAHGGQPASSAAWQSSLANERTLSFYANTRRTIDQAWVRPRFAGYLDFQRAGGALVEACLRDVLRMEPMLDQLDAAWKAARR